MAELVGERLHLGRVVHVHPDRDLAGEEVGQAVGAADRRSGGDQPELEPQGGDLVREAIPEAGGSLALKQVRAGELGDRVAGGLGDVPDVGGLEADQPRLDALAESGLLTPGEAMPRSRIGGVRRGESGSDGREDAVPVLALQRRGGPG